MHSDPSRMCELTTEDSLRRLASVPIGRIVFTHEALPAIRPVNHRVVDGDIVFRCHEGAALLTVVEQVVAYEADQIDAGTHTGWSVIVTGKASLVEDPDDISRYEQVVRPWVDLPMARVIRILPEFVTGFELIDRDR